MKDILLSDYKPVSELVVPKHFIQKSKYPSVDFHVHYTSKNIINCNYVEEFKELEKYGVHAVVSLDGGWGDDLKKSFSMIQDVKDKIVTFGGVDVTLLDRPDFSEYVHKTITDSCELGIKGLKFFKRLGLSYKDRNGKYIRPDDKRLKPVWETASQLNLPVLIHIADPIAFFKPVDHKNERFEQLNKKPEWSFCGEEFYTFRELMDMQENLIRQNPATTFILTHVGNASEDLGYVSGLLDKYKNVYIDIAARLAELGRQPYSSRRFFIRYQDRIMFSTDSQPSFPAADSQPRPYPYYWRFMETFDEYFDYSPSQGNGRWKIYGINLPDEVLRKVYYENALKLVPDLKKNFDLF